MKSLRKTLISLSLVGAMLAASPLGAVKAAADGEGKYVSEVYLAYGNSEEEATKWLKDNGWEPVKGNFGSGKERQRATVMGIHRTSDPSNAITDMAVMNLNGEYSFGDYSNLLKEKKVEINSVLDAFQPVIDEYRANFNGEGSEAGKARAVFVNELLNGYIDGEVGGEYSKNDTGQPIGDLLLNTTKYEYGDSKYDSLSQADKLKFGDFQQIILESMPATVAIIDELLVMATDTSETSWIERLQDMEGENLVDSIELYVDEAEPGMAQSAAENLLDAKYQDVAVKLSQQWSNIHDELVWLENYMNENSLEKTEEESEEDYVLRVETFFNNMNEEEPEKYLLEYNKYQRCLSLAGVLDTVAYEGEWGESLYDFFYPDDGTSYEGDFEKFTRFAAALSEGQRAGIDAVSLDTLIRMGVNVEDAFTETIENWKEEMAGREKVSVYSGVNRAIFRDGVALTSEAMNATKYGKDPYEDFWDFSGYQAMAYTSGVILITSIVAATVLTHIYKSTVKTMMTTYNLSENTAMSVISCNKYLGLNVDSALLKKGSASAIAGVTASVMAVCSGTFFIIVSVTRIKDYISNKYNYTFAKIPSMIVDEADIVSYKTDKDGNKLLDENGKPVKDINFDQFMYYDSAKCNRMNIGISDKAQEGVDKYKEWGCENVADLNGDTGKEWLALYTNKSSAKGNPILADSLTVQYGSDALPENCTKSLHKFRNTYAFNIANDTYSFSDKMKGIYLFWADDPKAYGTTASAAGSVFGTGLAALFGVGGLGLGILGTMLVMMPKRRKQEV